MELKFRRKAKSEWGVIYILIMPLLFALFTEILRIPEMVKYTIDVAWVGLLICMLSHKKQYATVYVKKLVMICVVFVGFTLIGFLLNYQSLFYYFWGIRNTIRVFVYFFACVFFINPKSVEYYLKFFDVAFWINAPIMLYQYFFVGLKQDYLGGIFGSSIGCNGYTNILFIVVVTKSILYCMNYKETVIRCLLKCAVALLLGALSELKAFYVESIMILILAMCFTKTSYRKFWIAIGTIAGVIVGARLIGLLFPFFKGWFSLDKMWSYISDSKGYTLSNDMNRLTAVSIALERFLPSIRHKLFGLGLGNCDYASYDFLVTPFYRAYGGLNYIWFSSAMIILETGLIGMGLYIFFFVQIFLSCWKMSKEPTRNKILCQLSMICSVMCGFLFILNSSLRTESGYLMFFVLALPFITKEQKETVGSEHEVSIYSK